MRSILYPEWLNDSEEPEVIKAKAEGLFEANLILMELPSQYDVRVNIARMGTGFLFWYTVICTICGSVVDKDKSFTQAHLELHIKRGE